MQFHKKVSVDLSLSSSLENVERVGEERKEVGIYGLKFGLVSCNKLQCIDFSNHIHCGVVIHCGVGNEGIMNEIRNWLGTRSLEISTLGVLSALKESKQVGSDGCINKGVVERQISEEDKCLGSLHFERQVRRLNIGNATAVYEEMLYQGIVLLLKGTCELIHLNIRVKVIGKGLDVLKSHHQWIDGCSDLLKVKLRLLNEGLARGFQKTQNGWVNFQVKLLIVRVCIGRNLEGHRDVVQISNCLVLRANEVAD